MKKQFIFSLVILIVAISAFAQNYVDELKEKVLVQDGKMYTYLPVLFTGNNNEEMFVLFTCEAPVTLGSRNDFLNASIAIYELSMAAWAKELNMAYDWFETMPEGMEPDAVMEVKMTEEMIRVTVHDQKGEILYRDSVTWDEVAAE